MSPSIQGGPEFGLPPPPQAIYSDPECDDCGMGLLCPSCDKDLLPERSPTEPGRGVRVGADRIVELRDLLRELALEYNRTEGHGACALMFRRFPHADVES